jgi:ketosteroid isomerase-like protein
VPRPAEIVERYFAAWTSGDFETARALLCDDLAFVGPFDTFDSADDLIRALRGLASVVTGAERRGLVADGDEVCVIYDLHTQPIERAAIAEWFRVRDGKIASLEAFFDARPFAPLFEARR